MKLVETQHIDEKDIHVKQGKEAISCNITIRKNVMRNFCFTCIATHKELCVAMQVIMLLVTYLLTVKSQAIQ